MIRTRIRRLLSIMSVALLGVAALGVTPVSAATPNWDIQIVPVPHTVGAGKDAGFIVTVSNGGPSQINALSVTVTPLDTPSALWTYLSDLVYTTGGPATCGTTAPLTCQLGTLVAGASVTFTVAYAVPAAERGDFDLEVAIRAGTGDTSSDGPKGKSRGDSLTKRAAAVIGSGDFDGGFVVGQDIYQTNPSITNRNIQSTGLAGAPELSGVMIEDGISSLAACDSVADDPACTGLFGEWSRLNVNNGQTFGTPFKVTLVIRGSAVPGGANANTIHVVHLLDDGSVEVIDTTCTFAGGDPVPTNAECLTVTKVGPNWQIEVWLLKNGAARGGV